MKILSGTLKGRRLKVPQQLSDKYRVRPTTGLVKGAIFSILGEQRVVKKRVLDLFSGSGALGFEAISRGAAHVTFVESERKIAQLLKENSASLGVVEKVEVIGADVLKALSFLEKRGEYFDLIFADPPYAFSELGPLLEKLDKSPLLAEDGVVVLEHGKKFSARLQNLACNEERKYGGTLITIYQRKVLLRGTVTAGAIK